MFRLTLVLCFAIYMGFLVAGRDNGQVRWGLAGVYAPTVAENPDDAPPVAQTAELPDGVAQLPLIAPAPMAEAAPGVTARIEGPVIADSGADGVGSGEPQADEDPVFTLATAADDASSAILDQIGNGLAGAEVEGVVQDIPATGSDIRVVTGASVNVRSGPSTQDGVVGRLTRGEEVLVIWTEDSGWARVRIEGDGIEGYIASRFLSE